ncbi:DUF3099 domain-containing protein [Paeniglutamicibacter sp. ABSL32-1]|uniref:DUF3099 domain-containing protein n=1 Tax=Paeniglutamicibacter quisquiliarum TaxID=2849498 RepID=UPI001C2CDA48|nr:DUF3099 domain-containing protein [Paeniglutamicibacter quisquiliarum]MBV1778596.1 DUF3099 domain-containing protein [Paeniglutamicibacter quisquiliarum]
MSEPNNTHHHHDQGQPVHRITEAQESHTVEQHSRVLKYTISMSVRLACFIAAFFVHGWLQWTFLAAAIVLPYVAVVIANGGADVTKRQPPAEYFAGDGPRPLASGGTAGTAPASADPEPDANDTEAGEPGAEARATDSWVGGESYVFEEFDETVTEPAATQAHSGSTPQDASREYWVDPASTYAAEAPSTIDGSFVEEPGEPGQPAGGHHRHGGNR